MPCSCWLSRQAFASPNWYACAARTFRLGPELTCDATERDARNVAPLLQSRLEPSCEHGSRSGLLHRATASSLMRGAHQSALMACNTFLQSTWRKRERPVQRCEPRGSLLMSCATR